jgi:uncharacterized membrane protein
MAGIGFELRRMIDERRGFVAKVRAYSCAALIASGPWLMTILTLTLLNVAGPYLGGAEGYSLFRGLVTYAFAFSLILQGIVQMAVTRWVADQLYGKRYLDVLPAFAACFAVTGGVHAAIGTAFCVWAGFGARLSLLVVSLFTIIGMTWIALIWLSLVRQYDDILRAYVYGTLVAMISVLIVFLSQGTEPILAAYTAGQAFTLILLLRTILRGMETGAKRDYRVFKSLISFPVLAGVGFAYNAAIWVDKMVFWFVDGDGPHPLVRYHPLYDTCSFLAYLTVVPALAVNLVQLETSFYEKYRAYYGAILAGSPLAVIERNKTRMFESLQEGVVRLLRLQGAITAAVVIFAPLIVQVLELPEIAVRLFRLTCLGAGFHVLLLICLLMQMYFDLRRQALATSAAFLVLNGTLAWWSVSRGIETYGVGYAVASFLTLLLGFVLLHRAIERLDYHTFTSQPIGSKEERREAEKLLEQEREKEAKEAAAAAPAAPVPAAPPQPAPFAAGEMGTIDRDAAADAAGAPAEPVVADAVVQAEAETPPAAAPAPADAPAEAAAIEDAAKQVEEVVAHATETLREGLKEAEMSLRIPAPAAEPEEYAGDEYDATATAEGVRLHVRPRAATPPAAAPGATDTSTACEDLPPPAGGPTAPAPSPRDDATADGDTLTDVVDLHAPRPAEPDTQSEVMPPKPPPSPPDETVAD